MFMILDVRNIVLAIFLLGCSAIGVAQDLAITHANVYAAPDTPLRRDVTVVIRHGIIATVGKHQRIPTDINTISCNGCFILAGFWNAHVHFMEPKWNDAANQPAENLTRQLDDMLTHSGFTTVVDCGSDGENTVALRRRVESGDVLGPRIFTAGFPLYPALALPYYLDGLPAELKAKMLQPQTPADAVSVVDKNRVAGFDIVKLFTGSIVGPNHIVPMQVAIARAGVDEAHRYGQLVFAHTTNLEGTKVAIDAGVDVLAHTPEVTQGIDDRLLRQMVAQHTTIIPTLKLFSRDDNIADIRGLAQRFHQLGEGWSTAPTPGFSGTTIRARNFVS